MTRASGVSPETASGFIARQKARGPREVKTKDIGRKGSLIWTIEAETYRGQTNYPLKVFVVQRLRLTEVRGDRLRAEIGADLGDIEYRIGYYIVSGTDKWWWGQYCPFIPKDDFEPLLEQARVEGTIL
jgi:hypothetical protein